jgi:hypothetical protein
MLLKEITRIYTDNRTNYMKQNAELMLIKARGTCIYRGL